MKALFLTLMNVLRICFIKSYMFYIKNRYYKTDVCFVWAADKNHLAFELISNDDVYMHTTTTATRGVWQQSEHFDKFLRKMVGERILSMYGVPREKEDVRTIFLALSPSVIRVIGFKRFYRFLKDWKGTSSVGNKSVAVQYMLGK